MHHTSQCPRNLDAGEVNYTYDAFDRLKNTCYPSCTGSQKNGFTYNYDPAGNITSRVAYLPSSDTTTTYAYNSDDQLCWAYVGSSPNGCASPPPGATIYSFEANGNQTTAGSRTFTWDLENRLLTTASGGTTHTYKYDGDGNRLQDSWGSDASMKTNYQWDVNVGLPQLALERDGNNVLLRRYVHGLDLISMRSGSSDYYYVMDLIGSVANLTSSTGATEWTYTYNPFGDPRSTIQNDPSAPTNLMRFDAQLIDTVDNLYYLRARMYDPGIARFLEMDRLAPPPHLPRAATYAYSRNRPTVFGDPSGLSPQGIHARDNEGGEGELPDLDKYILTWETICSERTNTLWVVITYLDPDTGEIVTYSKDLGIPCTPGEEEGDDDEGEEEPGGEEEEEPSEAEYNPWQWAIDLTIVG